MGDPTMGRNAVRWPLIGGLAVLVVVAVLGGVALSNAGPASAAVGAQADDTDWNTTNGSGAVADGCPPGDALRKEVYDGLEDRSVEEVRSVIPDDAVQCLPADVRNTLELENESDGNGTDGDDCPSAEAIRAEVDTELVTSSKAEVRAALSEDEIACLPADVIDQLDIGTGSENGTEDSNDSSSGGIECPSDAEMRVAVETALADGSVTTVREQIPEDYRDCLPTDVKDELNIEDDAANASAATDPETESGDASGTETEGVDCPAPETVREEVNMTLERMSAAQFRTMVHEDYVECFPPDVRERLGLTATAGTDSDGGTPTDADTSVDGPGSTGADSGGAGVGGDPATVSSDELTDSDDDGVPDRYDYAPRDPDVQSKNDVQAAGDPGSDDGSGGSGDEIPVAAGSALLLVLAAGIGGVVYRRYGGPSGGADDELPRPSEPVATGEASAQPHDVFGESAFDPDGAAGSGTEFTFDEHGDDDGFVFDNDDEDVITLDSDGSVADEEVDAGFVFEGGPELDEGGEPADD
ncbi:hypothetical protein BV210_08140 [Halorientalis sp. IM1011]|nr:hypothetical protein BV210_08140 [Halorientalis sp. IM1011]